MKLITTIYNLLWGDLVTIPLPGGGARRVGRSGGARIVLAARGREPTVLRSQ